MPIAPTYTLTIDLATINGSDLSGIQVEAAMANPQLIDSVDSESLYPTQEHAVTDDNGEAQLILLPSIKVGNYKITIGTYSREITMPERDARLSEFDSAGRIVEGSKGAGMNVHMWSQADTSVPTGIPVSAQSGFPHVTFEADNPPPNGHLVIAQEASENDINSIVKNGVEQIGAFDKGNQTFDQGGVTYEYWISEALLFGSTIAGTYTLKRA